MESKIEINTQIDKYTSQAKRVKNIAPSIMVVAFISATFFLKSIEDYTFTSCMGIGSIILVVSSFVYAYFKSMNKAKALKEKLSQLN